MSLPTPRLDDRTFQQLVDEAKLRVQKACPTWTNHNVADPGVALIETFAWMTELLLYRVNRVPQRVHARFLELLGVDLFPPRAGRTEISFRLSSHHATAVTIPAGTMVSTRRTAGQEAISFTTVTDLQVAPATSTLVGTMSAGQPLVDRTALMGLGGGVEAFAEPPSPGDAVYVRLDQPAPSAILLLQLVCTVGGHGIDPLDPPLVWEASTGAGWARCDVELDMTRGLNVSGAVELHLPADHAELSVPLREEGGTRPLAGAWVRCRVVDRDDTPSYDDSPQLVSVTAATVGGDVDAMHADVVERESLGVSDGTTGQRFAAQHTPVLPHGDFPVVLQVRTVDGDAGTAADPDVDTGWVTWQRVDDFSESGGDSLHFTISHSTGEVRFGPLVRLADGTVRQHGAVPPRGSAVRLRTYSTGGGVTGNVAARSVAVLRSSIPYVAAVYNRRPGAGGVAGETVEEAMTRGPLELRRRGRAVTADDYVAITREAAPELARVHCLPVTDGGAEAVRVLVVPQVRDPDGKIDLAELRLPSAARDKVVRALEAARMIGARVSVEPARYVGVRVDAQVRAVADADVTQVERAAVAALHRYFNPVVGGPDGRGWPLGRPVQRGEIYAVLGRVPGVDYVEDAVLFRANARGGDVGQPEERINLDATHLVLSVEHLVHVADEE